MTDRSRWIALYVLCLGTLMIVLDVTIVNVALPSIKADLGFSSDLARMGRERLSADLRRLPAPRRAARRSLRPPAPVPDRDRALHARFARVRPLEQPGSADRGARGAGPRRRCRLRRLASAHDDALHRAGRAREGDGHLRLRRLGRRLDRRAARRRAYRLAQLALDLPRQRADRHRSSVFLSLRLLPATPGTRSAGSLDVGGRGDA